MKRILVFAMFLCMGIMNTNAQEDRFDLNDDGDVNITDVILLVNYILGKTNGNNATGQAIDLGLPSGKKWASCNIGATKPEEYGCYFAWGETEEKDVYDVESYVHSDGTYSSCYDIGRYINGTEYDVAHVKWGDKWQIPTYHDFEELLNNCESEWTTLNDVNGFKLTSKINGNSIFLPAAGYRKDGDLCDDGQNGRYWSAWRDPSYIMYYANGFNIDSDNAGIKKLGKSIGLTIRPVEVLDADDVTAEMIDLGLPSGIMWASHNVGATKPEQFGNYYAWGETEKKYYFEWSNYIYSINSTSTCQDIGIDISGTEYDVAHVKWGGNWCMPNREDIEEMLDNCNNERTTLNGVKGFKFISKINGNSIFLPATGSYDGELDLVGEVGHYWSSTVLQNRPFNAHVFINNASSSYRAHANRYRGLNVRPIVRK
jgi:uncharacterized protein (TIGR02145 family)